jgi:hypothetical protein
VVAIMVTIMVFSITIVAVTFAILVALMVVVARPAGWTGPVDRDSSQ